MLIVIFSIHSSVSAFDLFGFHDTNLFSMLFVGEMQSVGPFPPLRDRVFHSTELHPAIETAAVGQASTKCGVRICLAYQSYQRKE